MKKLLITLLLLTAPLIGSATLVLPKTNPAVVPPAAKPVPAAVPAPVKPLVTTVDEEDDEETEALPAAAQTSAPAKAEQSTPSTASSGSEKTTTTTPSTEKPVAPKPVQPVQPAMPEEDTRPLAVFNKTGRTMSLYGKTGDDPAKLLTTLKVGDAPAQMIYIPVNVETLYVQDPARSTLLPIDEGVQLVTIAIASSLGTFTYSLNSIVPEYGEHIIAYNATDNDQIVIMKTSAKVPGIFRLTTATQSYAYTIPAETMRLITIPQLALPAAQDKKIECGLPSSATPLTINSDEQNMFIITQDNETPVIHKV